MKKERLQYIDLMKGIGIILVILGHVSINKVLTNTIYSFHMPLFFTISGLTYYLSKKENFYLKKVKSILIPYLFFSIISFCYWVLIERNLRGQENVSAIKQLTNIFLAKAGSENYAYNAPMWFLPCLFVVSCCFCFLNMKTGSRKKIMLFDLVIISFIGFVLSLYFKTRLPFCIDVAMQGILFYGLGYLIAPYLTKGFNLQPKKLKAIETFLGIGTVMILFFVTYVNCGINMSENRYGNYILYLIGAIAGIIFTFLISKNIMSKTLEILGKNSLIIMCIHEPIKRIIIKMFAVILKVPDDAIRLNIVSILAISVITLVLSLVAARVISMKLPFTAGQSYKKIVSA